MQKYIAVVFLLCLACLAVSAIPGGFENVDVDDEGVQRAADHAARALSKQFSGKYHHRLVKVIKAKRQVVAGYNYEMDIIVGQTTCEKSNEYDSECELQDHSSAYKKCNVRVYKDLKDSHKLVASGCILASRDEV